MDADDNAIGPYTLVQRIGTGGMASVFLAVHEGLQKPVVIKVLHPELASDEETRARFLREGAAASRIRHPHVIAVNDLGERDGMPYLVMEHLEGECLRARIERVGPMRPDEVADLLVPVVDAVDAAHAAGVVHRDLKPANLYVTVAPHGRVHPMVLDFGISRMVGGDAVSITQSTTMLGTPAYMAPELAIQARRASPASDQYAIGAIAYECLTGCKAFEGGGMFELLRRVSTGDFPRPRALRPDVPEALEALVLRAMAVRAESRFPSMRALRDALLPFASAPVRALWGHDAEPSPARPDPVDAHAATVALAPSPTALAHAPTALAPAAPPATHARALDDTQRIPRRARPARVAAAALCVAACVAALGLARSPSRASPPPSQHAVAPRGGEPVTAPTSTPSRAAAPAPAAPAAPAPSVAAPAAVAATSPDARPAARGQRARRHHARRHRSKP